MNKPDAIRQPLGITVATFAAIMTLVMLRAVTAPYPAETALTADMPLGALIDSLFRNAASANAAGAAIALLNAILLSGIIVRYSVSPVRTYLPMTLYTMTAFGLCVPFGSVSAMLASLLLLVSTNRMIDSFKRSYQFGNVFKSAFFIGMMPMLYAPATLLLPIIPVTLILYRRTLRETATAMTGMLLPTAMCSVFWWLAGSPWSYICTCLWKGMTTPVMPSLATFAADTPLGLKIYAALCTLLTMVSIVTIIARITTLRTRAKKIYLHFIWLAALCMTMPVLPGSDIAAIAIAAVPVSALISAFFTRFRGWLSFSVYLAMLSVMAIINLSPLL